MRKVGLVGTMGVFGARDNGEGADAPPDEMTLFFTEVQGPPNNCDDVLFLIGIGAINPDDFLMPIEAGHVLVRP